MKLTGRRAVTLIFDIKLFWRRGERREERHKLFVCVVVIMWWGQPSPAPPPHRNLSGVGALLLPSQY